jgi:hypothetical protein
MAMCLPIIKIVYSDKESVKRLDGCRFRQNRVSVNEFTELYPAGYVAESTPEKITVVLTPMALSPAILGSVYEYAYEVKYDIKYNIPAGHTVEGIMRKLGEYISGETVNMGMIWLTSGDISRLRDEAINHESFIFLDLAGR